MGNFMIISILLFFLLVSPALADITLTNWQLNKQTAYEDEEVFFTVYVESSNDTKSVIAEIAVSGLGLVNQTYKNLTLTSAGSVTKGNWIYTFKEKEGIYEIVRLIATDNSSNVKVINVRQIAFLALKVVKNETTTNITTTNVTTTTTTTTSQTTETTQTIETTTEQTTLTPEDRFLPKIPFGNPLIALAIAVGILLPFILIIIFLK